MVESFNRNDGNVRVALIGADYPAPTLRTKSTFQYLRRCKELWLTFSETKG